MVTVRIIYGFVFVWYNDKIFIKTKSLFYAVKMVKVLKDEQ